MRKSKKLIGLAGLAAIVAFGTLGIVTNARAESFTTTGGTYNKTWNCSLSSTVHGAAIYRLTGTAQQPGAYKFDNVSINVTLYCNNSTNSTKSASDTNVYKISTFADASTGISNGKGTALISVSDDTYGHATKRIYN